ncbi:Rogdi leucine zipper containing protein-domain-containing protein [Aspergillus caelatus]|uniref:Rogdi leucine zipper containing protein-domain-containing protein n=1 Tax=Aspergillus caelatus TaxID=61420 RepID=A0A5N6ZYX9_9EURO|nr:Rogdi leucine zipper containing protein-domain-containing protein [Aspergillus caelatus]KAE8362804.1 Rogdi leucine zipper containing protein-domain-containing protein [Aspergillus caelatus]
MATWVYPPLPPQQLEREADSALARELEWLLRSLQDSLASLREGLHECAALLAPKEPGSTLVVSSVRSEIVKGFITRVGTEIVKGDIQLRLGSLAPARGSPTTRLCLSNSPDAPELVLHQLVSVRNLVNQSLDVVDVSTWTGDPLNASFIYGQLRLLYETLSEARQMLKGESDQIRGKWWETSALEDMFDPPLPPNLSFHLSIADSALVLYLRTLESSTPTHTPTAFATDISLTGFNLRDRLFGTRHRAHDEAGDVFTWKGDEVKTATGYSIGGFKNGRRYASTVPPADGNVNTDRKDAVYNVIDKIEQNEMEMAELMDELSLLDDYWEALNLDGPELDHAFSETIGHRDQETLEARVQEARQVFGDTLPDGFLNDTELQLYTRLYGEPIIRQEELELEVEEDEKDPDVLYREDGQGGWEAVDFEQAESEDEPPMVYDMEAGPVEDESIAMQRTREVAEQLGGEIMLEQFEEEANPDDTPRLHPLTVEGKFSTDPSTVFLPKDTVTGPISIILSDYSNKHIADVAHRTFGGTRLPYSTTTPPPRAQMPQLPIPLDASQRHMTEMEANAYIAALYPGMYTSILSTLVEVRKRLGTEWLRGLISKEDGPHILDASAGGAGVLAWRDVVRAEWESMVPDHPKASPYPVGRSTVVTGSDALRMRASLMLENTSFLPRLPDYVHIREKPTLDDERAPPKRKQYDIIVAPHSLLGIEEEFLRKEHVENLWNLLNPEGGVLILLEKGHQKGFEAIAAAREMILKRLVSSPGSTEYTNFTESPIEDSHIEKEPGMIVAPCTNHEKCPMFNTPGHSKGRKDYCHFQQRYIRPSFLQRILGAKDRNHEDVKFSYIAVQRGVDLRETKGIVQGPEATEAAFAGYEDLHETAVEEPEASDEATGSQTEASEQVKPENFHTLSLPRIVYPPMKRRGHVIFDFCTPAGKIERWTVPRSYSRRAYKDARKSNWGDLWALGAKTRIPRGLRLGDKHGEGKKERLARRAALRAELAEEGELEQQSEGSDWPEVPIPQRKKGQTIPSWKKHADKKKLRLAQFIGWRET